MLMKLLTGLHVVCWFPWCLHQTALSPLLHQLVNILLFQIPDLVLSAGSQLVLGILTFLFKDPTLKNAFIKTSI